MLFAQQKHASALTLYRVKIPQHRNFPCKPVHARSETEFCTKNLSRPRPIIAHMPYHFVTPPSVDVNIDRILKMDNCNHKGLVSCVTTRGWP